MNPTSVITAEQTTSVNAVLVKVFQWVIDFLYTIINVLIDFFTQPAVLWALAVIAIIVMAYKKLRSKQAHF